MIALRQTLRSWLALESVSINKAKKRLKNSQLPFIARNRLYPNHGHCFSMLVGIFHQKGKWSLSAVIWNSSEQKTIDKEILPNFEVFSLRTRRIYCITFAFIYEAEILLLTVLLKIMKNVLKFGWMIMLGEGSCFGGFSNVMVHKIWKYVIKASRNLKLVFSYVLYDCESRWIWKWWWTLSLFSFSWCQ